MHQNTFKFSGNNTEQSTYIPSMDLHSEDGLLSFNLKRRQFPMKLAFCMTINKAQDQSLNKFGIHLSKLEFGHGQLYLALFRAGNLSLSKILMKNIKNT